MNIEAKSGLELATKYSSYTDLVVELANKMEVREDVFLPTKKGKKFDYEDIFDWIKAVGFADGIDTRIDKTIKEDGGVKTVRLSTEGLEEVIDVNKPQSKESQLYEMAVTEAKMEVIRSIAEETYPALAFQIKDYQKEMKKVRQEIFEIKDSKDSIKKILERMTAKGTIRVATASVLLMMILAACNGGATETRAAETPTATMPVAACTWRSACSRPCTRQEVQARARSWMRPSPMA